MFKVYNYIYIMLITFSIIIMVSSNNWMSMWMGLELNMMSFIIFSMMKYNKFNSECLCKYFIIQSFSSMILMFFIISSIMNFFFEWFFFLILLIKLGMFPFHYWMIDMGTSISWNSLFFLLTIQKLGPLIIMSNFINHLTLMFIIMSSIFCSFLGISQVLVKKILVYTSIFHLSWIMLSIYLNFNLLMTYLLSYIISSYYLGFMCNKVNFNHLSSYSNLLDNNSFIGIIFSLMGLPPFFGFFTKWVMIINMLKDEFMFMTLIFIFSSLLNMYTYMRLMYYIYMLSSMKWMMKSNKMNFGKNFLMKFFLLFMLIPFCFN
uniref:NADH-ubiquinone oxidoreductase chain 2 n=1 Tax=Acerella muscorum TaxID=187596 RepID=A0A0C4K5J9_9HEXA|nr:NADH dehydrogenase subunit 2 [Acerella muscorum]AHL42961.1 NADH dehydrogenase subunit 2 [Acerella muscorum]